MGANNISICFPTPCVFLCESYCNEGHDQESRQQVDGWEERESIVLSEKHYRNKIMYYRKVLDNFKCISSTKTNYITLYLGANNISICFPTPCLFLCESYCNEGHDQESRQQVDGWEGAREYEVVLNYNISFEHVEELVDQSGDCKQYISWECFAALIHNPNDNFRVSTGWLNRYMLHYDLFQ